MMPDKPRHASYGLVCLSYIMCAPAGRRAPPAAADGASAVDGGSIVALWCHGTQECLYCIWLHEMRFHSMHCNKRTK